VRVATEPARDVAITLAGGGNRAFYQLGLVQQWAERLTPRLAGLATCSAGACVAIMWLTGRRWEARDVFLRRTKGLTKNVDFSKALRGERIAPHGSVYTDILLTMLRDGGLETIRQLQWPVLVLVSGFPGWLPSAVAATVGIGAYQLEKALRPRVLHPTFGRAIGFRPEVYDLRDCETAEEATALVLASSATPPFTPVGRFRGRRYLDGGMVDNAPAFAGDDLPGARRNLVLLTRPYAPDLLGRQGGRLYIAPREPLPVGRWDYTRPEAVDLAVDVGARDAVEHLPALDAFLGDGAETGSDPVFRGPDENGV
jgi:hypothetical protein